MMYYLRLIFSKIFNRTTFTILMLLLLSAIIWFIGPLIAVADFRPIAPAWVRWTMIGVIWLLWFIKLLVRWWRERNVNAALLGQLAKMQSSAKPGDGPAAGSEEIGRASCRERV